MRVYLAAAFSMLAVNASLASEAFIPQMTAKKHFSSEMSTQSMERSVLSASAVASPLSLSAAKPDGSFVSNPTNISYIAQQGTNNLAAVTQTGGRNLSAITQSGVGNQAIVTQHR